MKNDSNKIPLATEIIKEQKNKLKIYKTLSIILEIIIITLLIILFMNRG